jgi:tetraacyldisaccharide 4'-kinase
MVFSNIKQLIYLPSHKQPVFFKIFFAPLALMFCALTALRNLLYDAKLNRTKRLPGTTISIGNIAVGGTGKTPVVIEVAKYLSAKGFSPAILTRGYKSGLVADHSLTILGGNITFHEQNSEQSFHGDEAMMQSHALPHVPVIVGSNRWKAAFRYMAAGKGQPTHWILDDGFQLRSIHRDIDVVLFDAENPWGSGWVMPRGFLRESLRSVKRASAVLFTRSTEQAPSSASQKLIGALTIAPQFKLAGVANRFYLVHGPKDILHDVTNWRVLAVSAIARPEVFIESLTSSGVNPTIKKFLPDHHCFKPHDLQDSLAKVDLLITTAKDYWRQPELFDNLPKPVAILDFQLTFNPPDLEAIFSKVAK